MKDVCISRRWVFAPKKAVMTAALCCAALVTIAGTTARLVAEASSAATPEAVGGSAGPGAVAANSMFRLDSSLVSPVSDFLYQTPGVSSSSSAVAEERLSLGETLSGSGEQPPPGRRRSYGRSRYQDRMHNQDGSSRIAFMAGAGLNLPVGNTGKFYTPSYDVAAGAGINFNKMFGVLGEFHYDHAGVTGGAINYEYNQLLNLGATPDELAGFDGNAHVFSLTVDPVLNFASEQSKFGAYVTGGAGYYRKTTNFTLPSCGQDYFGYTYCNNVNVDSASANSFGFNGGFGLTYKISSFSSERLFIEARYHWLKIDSNNNTDFFPFNRRNSEYVPILVGIRF